MEQERRTAKRFVLEGRVQGVGFRWWARQEAERMGVRGWVRNRGDGSVEVVAEGEAGELARFRERLGEGPRGARVDHMEEEVTEMESGDRKFEIRL